MKETSEILMRQWPNLLFAIVTAFYSGYLLRDLVTKSIDQENMHRFHQISIKAEQRHLRRQVSAILFLVCISIFTFIRVCFLGGF